MSRCSRLTYNISGITEHYKHYIKNSVNYFQSMRTGILRDGVKRTSKI